MTNLIANYIVNQPFHSLGPRGKGNASHRAVELQHFGVANLRPEQ